MEVLNTVSELKALRQQLGGTAGLVPTMGYLHQGHLALVKQARAENSALIVSIYVNPTQFGPADDFAVYPRDLDRDLDMLREEKTDVVFVPSDVEMYPPGFGSWIDVQKVGDRLEGASRPGHFRGVATVVAKLLNIVRPSRAYFGQKDAQQVAVIKRMVADLHMETEIVVVPTVREEGGLAMSSRNLYLGPEERRAGTVLFKALTLAQQLTREGECDADRIRSRMTSLIRQEPLARIDYVSIVDGDTFEEVDLIDRPAVACLAVRIGETRLIDNMPLA
jgi:pantoate--beta-alanine ligase